LLKTQHYMHSSNASSHCRFELRPSRWLLGALLALGVLAPISVLASEMPRAVALPLALLVSIIGLGLALRDAWRPTLRVVIEAPDRVSIDDAPVDDFTVQWRGALAFLRWRDAAGRRHARSLWPDTLSPRLRRELRLAIPESNAGRGRDSMAP
jgi:toxin CptA